MPGVLSWCVVAVQVLSELVGDQSLERFRLEYEKLHRALKQVGCWTDARVCGIHVWYACMVSLCVVSVVARHEAMVIIVTQWCDVCCLALLAVT